MPRSSPPSIPLRSRRRSSVSPHSILQVGAGWFPEHAGGLERVYHNLLMHLPDEGVQPRGLVVGSESVGPSSDGLVSAFARPDASLITRCWQARRAVQSLLASSSVDLVAAHFALYAAPWIDLVDDIPFVMHFHGPWAAETRAESHASSVKGYLQSTLERYVYQRADLCIVLSEAFADLLHREYGVDRSRIRVVPGGVDVSRFNLPDSQRTARQRLGLPLDRPILLSVRRLAQRMGLENLVAALPDVLQHLPDALLLIAGSGPMQDELQAQIDDAGLHDHVRLLGFVPETDLPLTYRAADVSIVPTTHLEGFGLITLESLAAGTPVLVTPVGGMPEPLRPFHENLVLDGTSPTHLAEGLVGALTGTRSLPSAAQCREYVREHFDWPVITSRILDVYHELLP